MTKISWGQTRAETQLYAWPALYQVGSVLMAIFAYCRAFPMHSILKCASDRLLQSSATWRALFGMEVAACKPAVYSWIATSYWPLSNAAFPRFCQSSDPDRNEKNVCETGQNKEANNNKVMSMV